MSCWQKCLLFTLMLMASRTSCAVYGKAEQCIKVTTSDCDGSSPEVPIPRGGPPGPAGPKGEPGESVAFEPTVLQNKVDDLENKITSFQDTIIKMEKYMIAQGVAMQALKEKVAEGGGDTFDEDFDDYLYINPYISGSSPAPLSAELSNNTSLDEQTPGYRLELTPYPGNIKQVRAMCKELGGDVIQKCLYKDPSGSDYSATIEALRAGHSPWIGITDRRHEGRWQFLKGGYFVEDTDALLYKWRHSEPNNSGRGGEDCAMIYQYSGELNDVSCASNFYAICEIPIVE